MVRSPRSLRSLRSRSIAVALLGLGVALFAACAAKQQNGQECLKADDCESARCIQYVCVDPNASRPTVTVDTGTAVETGTDTGSSTDTGSETPTPPADTGTETSSGTDTGSSDDSSASG